MWTPKYFILVTFSIVASGDPMKSVGRMEARLDLFNMYLHFAAFKTHTVVSKPVGKSQLEKALKSGGDLQVNRYMWCLL